MNMNQNPTVDQLRALVAACRGADAHHVMWIESNGEVHIDPVPDDLTPVGFEHAKGSAMKYRYETFVAGNGYVGAQAAADAVHMKELFDDLNAAWSDKDDGTGAWVGGTHGG